MNQYPPNNPPPNPMYPGAPPVPQQQQGFPQQQQQYAPAPGTAPGLSALIPPNAQPPQYGMPPQQYPTAASVPQYAQSPGFPTINGQPPQQAFGSANFDPDAVAASAMAGNRFPFFEPGQYILRIDRTLVTAFNPSFISEFEIVASNNPNVKVGEMRTWCQKLGSDPKSKAVWPGILKAFFVNALGAQNEQQLVSMGIDQTKLAHVMKAGSDPNAQVSTMYPPNPLKGRLVQGFGSPKTIVNRQTGQQEVRTNMTFAPYVA